MDRPDRRQIRVLHVANIDVGLKYHLGNYMSYQRNQGYTVCAITNPGDWIQHDTTILNDIGVKVISFPPRLSPWEDLKALVQLFAYIRRNDFDVVHTHTIKPGLLGRLAALAAGVPVIVHTVHGFHFYEGMSPTRSRFYVGVETLGAACCDLLLSQNRQDIHSAIIQGICLPDKIHLLGNGIDLSRFNPSAISLSRTEQLRREFRISPATPVVGFAARFEREKGVHEFLQAASKLKSQGLRAVFVMVGVTQKGRHSAVSPDKLIHEMGLDAEVLLPGFRDDMPELLSIMDMIVLPSHGREGIPRILMESAAMGKPVVATSVRGIVETVIDGTTGLLVPARDADALAAAMVRIINDRPLASALGANARQHALRHFDEQHVFRRTDREYRRLLNARLGIDATSLLAPLPRQTTARDMPEREEMGHGL
jgi:glycosyltransferase involved in cell wall biosynthesis